MISGGSLAKRIQRRIHLSQPEQDLAEIVLSLLPTGLKLKGLPEGGNGGSIILSRALRTGGGVPRASQCGVELERTPICGVGSVEVFPASAWRCPSRSTSRRHLAPGRAPSREMGQRLRVAPASAGLDPERQGRAGGRGRFPRPVESIRRPVQSLPLRGRRCRDCSWPRRRREPGPGLDGTPQWHRRDGLALSTERPGCCRSPRNRQEQSPAGRQTPLRPASPARQGSVPAGYSTSPDLARRPESDGSARLLERAGRSGERLRQAGTGHRCDRARLAESPGRARSPRPEIRRDGDLAPAGTGCLHARSRLEYNPGGAVTAMRPSYQLVLQTSVLRHGCVRGISQTLTSNRMRARHPPEIAVIEVNEAQHDRRSLWRGSASNFCVAAFMAQTKASASSAASAHGRQPRQWLAKSRASAADSRFITYASAVSSISVGHAPGRYDLGTLITISAGPQFPK